MKWFIILFVITLSFLIVFKFLYFENSLPFFNLSSLLGNNNNTSFYVNGSLFSLIILGDQNPIEHDDSISNLLPFKTKGKNTDVVDLVTSSLMDILINQESKFTLDELLPNSEIADNKNYNNMGKLLILNGSWILDVKNGEIISFTAKISKISKDGISPHTYEILNFIDETDTPIRLSETENNIIKGKAQIITPNDIINVDLYLILQKNTISIILQPKIIDDDYLGQPIYGLTNYIRT